MGDQIHSVGLRLVSGIVVIDPGRWECYCERNDECHLCHEEYLVMLRINRIHLPDSPTHA